MEVQLRNRLRGMGETCDPFDTACIERNLVAQVPTLPPCLDHPELCYGGSQYNLVTAEDLARIAATGNISTGPNPYAEVLWVQKDADGTWHHFGANNRELFVTYTDGSVRASGAPISPLLQQQLIQTNRIVIAAAAGLPYPTMAPAPTGAGTRVTATNTAPVSAGGFQLPASFTEDVSLGGFSFPMWAIIAAAGVAVLLFMGKSK